jgi:integrase
MTGHVRRRGNQSWELKFDAGRDEKTGKRITRYHSFRGTKKDAGIKLAEIIASVGKGSYVSGSKLTVAEHVAARIDQWEALGNISARTAERYREQLENQIKPHIGTKAVQKLKPADVESWHAILKTAGRKDGTGGLSAITITHAHGLLSKALKDGVRHDLVVRNVATVEPPPRDDDDQEIVILEEQQVRTAIEKLRGHAMYPKAITALFTGLRRGELLALRWRHVDIDGQADKTIRVREAIEQTKAHGIRFKKPKTKYSSRDVSLPDIVVEALRSLRLRQLEDRVALGLGRPSDDALIFPKLDGTPRSPRAFSKDWADVAKSIGVPVTFHALRHTHASHLIDAGIDVVKISRRLGHSSPTVTLKIYAHLFRNRDDKSSAAINDAVAGILRL